MTFLREEEEEERKICTYLRGNTGNLASSKRAARRSALDGISCYIYTIHIARAQFEPKCRISQTPCFPRRTSCSRLGSSFPLLPRETLKAQTHSTSRGLLSSFLRMYQPRGKPYSSTSAPSSSLLSTNTCVKSRYLSFSTFFFYI